MWVQNFVSPRSILDNELLVTSRAVFWRVPSREMFFQHGCQLMWFFFEGWVHLEFLSGFGYSLLLSSIWCFTVISQFICGPFNLLFLKSVLRFYTLVLAHVYNEQELRIIWKFVKEIDHRGESEVPLNQEMDQIPQVAYSTCCQSSAY